VSEEFVLDTSAIFAYLEDEDGADTVRDALRAAERGDWHIAVCFVTLTELRYILIQEQDIAGAIQATAIIKSWPISWVHSSEELCNAAADIKAVHRVSLADSFVAATAKLNGATLMHKDPEFQALDGIVRLRPLPFKGS